MANQTELCNIALGKLGSFTITSIDENSAEARHCLHNFDAVRRTLLREYDWNFATKYTGLSQIAGGASFGYDYAYALPGDYLRVLSFDGIKAGIKQPRWKMAGGRIYSDTDNPDDADSDTAKLEYIADITDCTLWDDQFGTAFCWYLAAAICPAIKQDPKLAIGLLQAGQAFLADAKGSDTVEDAPKVIRGLEHSRYQAARAGWGLSVTGAYYPPWMFQDFGPPGHSES